MRNKLQLQTSGTATANAAGVARVQLGPQKAGESWVVKGYAVANDSALTQLVTCNIYRNVVSDTTLVDGTYQGQSRVSRGDNLDIGPGNTLIAEWTGCTPGSISTFIVNGELSR